MIPDREAKSISHETTFAVDIADPIVLRAWLLELTDQVARRLRRHDLRGGTVHLKVRFADFRTITRSQKLDEATSGTDPLSQAACHLFDTRVSLSHQAVRLLGMGVSAIVGTQPAQGYLFDQEQKQLHARLDHASDTIKDRFGSSALRRASAMEHRIEHRAQPHPDEDRE